MKISEFEALPLKAKVILTDGREGVFVCAWFAKGNGGRRIIVDLPDGKAIQVGLRQIRSKKV